MKETIQIMIDDDLINQSNLIFNKINLDMETAITLFLKQCVIQQKIPFQYTIEDQKQLHIDTEY